MALPTESHVAKHLDHLATSSADHDIVGKPGPDAPLGDRQVEANGLTAAFLVAYAAQTRLLFEELDGEALDTVRMQLLALSTELDRCAALDELETAR